MPKLLIFAPCERLIREQDTQNISLISVLQTLTVQVPLEHIDRPIAAPFRWDLLTMWGREVHDEGKKYHETCELIGPSGEVLQSFSSEFSIEKDIAYVIFVAIGFPIVPGGGQYKVVLYLSESGGKDRKEITTYPIDVKRETVPPPSPTSASV